MKRNVFVLCGGISVEHEISLRSAKSILNNLNREKYNVFPVFITHQGTWVPLGLWNETIEDPNELSRTSDMGVAQSIQAFLVTMPQEKNNLFIPCLHGTFGEDGTIQGFLEILDVPYVGNGVLASACCMDKVVTNQLLEQHHIPEAKYVAVHRNAFREDADQVTKSVESKLPYPVFVKPANAGSSVGVNRASNQGELHAAIEEALIYDPKVLIEEEVIGREIEVSVLGNDFPIASLPGEYVYDHAFFDYDAKYQDTKTIIKTPTELPPGKEDEIRKLAIDAYSALGCYGFARVDIFLRESDHVLLVNEINSFPGMTATSLSPRLWEATDQTDMTQLIDRLIAYADEKYQAKKASKRIRG